MKHLWADKTIPIRSKKISLQKGLADYSSAAGAAMLCAAGASFALPTEAQGAITPITTVSGAHFVLSTFSSAHVTAGPLNPGFVFAASPPVRYEMMFNVAAGSNFVKTNGLSNHWALNLNANSTVKGAHFYGYAPLGGIGSAGSQAGFFHPAGANGAVTGYLGLKKVAAGQTYYGWLRVQVKNNDGHPNEINIIAVDGVYGAWGLKTDTVKAGEAVPEPSTAGLGGLALLALGAAGVRETRKRRKAAAAK